MLKFRSSAERSREMLCENLSHETTSSERTSMTIKTSETDDDFAFHSQIVAHSLTLNFAANVKAFDDEALYRLIFSAFNKSFDRFNTIIRGKMNLNSQCRFFCGGN